MLLLLTLAGLIIFIPQEECWVDESTNEVSNQSEGKNYQNITIQLKYWLISGCPVFVFCFFMLFAKRSKVFISAVIVLCWLIVGYVLRFRKVATYCE
jgi:hypothetical protein